MGAGFASSASQDNGKTGVPMKTLLVDDAPEKVAEIIALLISIPGILLSHIDVARSGLEARERLQNVRYDLLILDIKLPFRSDEEPDRRGGMNLLTEISLSNRFIKPTLVIALTGFGELKKEFESKFNNGEWTVDTYDPSDIGWRERLKARASYMQKCTSLTNRSAFETDLCVIAALNSPELDAVRSLPWSWSPPESFDPVTFYYRGSLSSGGRTFSVAAAAAPRFGMVAATTLANKMITNLKPRVLAMVGICAGMPGACEIGDVIVANPSWEWQMGKYTQDAFEIAPDQIGIPIEITERFSLLKQDRRLALSISEAFKGEKPNRLPTIHIGPLASGSAVLADTMTQKAIKEQHRKLLGVDMEMYGVYSAARDTAPPRPLTFGVKAVSDYADVVKNDKYQGYAAFVSARILCAFSETFFDQII
jgi:nucleoside phosphorylase/CheY-like chemotaxis protein